MLNGRTRRPTHPGKFLRDVVLAELKMSQAALAARIGISRRSIGELLRERRRLSIDVALRLARALKTSPDVWLEMQRAVDIWDTLQRHQHDYEKIKAIRPKKGA
jgi:antitoxin HigA-1